MNALEREKENNKVFHFSDIAQIISELCGQETNISGRQTSNIKGPTAVLNRG